MSQVQASELALIISGRAKINSVEVLKRLTSYDGHDEESRVIVWFWECLSGWKEQQISEFLGCVTGSPQMPPDGPIVIKKAGSFYKWPAKKLLGLPSYPEKGEVCRMLEELVNHQRSFKMMS